jgi:rubrerythrin
VEDKIIPEIMEGGMTTEEFLSANRASLETVGDVLILAMMLEAQALDLYSRYAHRCANPQTKQVLYELAGEEKEHLTRLGELKETR